MNFDKKIKEALMIIKKSPTSFKNTQLIYKGLNIYMNNIKSYLFFCVVDDVNIWILRVLKERMNWENSMKIWIKQNDYLDHSPIGLISYGSLYCIHIQINHLLCRCVPK